MLPIVLSLTLKIVRILAFPNVAIETCARVSFGSPFVRPSVHQLKTIWLPSGDHATLCTMALSCEPFRGTVSVREVRDLFIEHREDIAFGGRCQKVTHTDERGHQEADGNKGNGR